MGVEDVVEFIESKCESARLAKPLQNQHRVVLKILDNPARYGVPLPIKHCFEGVELRGKKGTLITEIDAVFVSEHHIAGVEVKTNYNKFSKAKASWQLDRFHEIITRRFGITPLLYIAHGLPNTDNLRGYHYEPTKLER